jgi:hypothetical protein
VYVTRTLQHPVCATVTRLHKLVREKLADDFKALCRILSAVQRRNRLPAAPCWATVSPATPVLSLRRSVLAFIPWLMSDEI